MQNPTFDEAIMRLRHNTDFQVVCQRIFSLREVVIHNLTNDSTVLSDNLVKAAVGELRAYNDLLDSFAFEIGSQYGVDKLNVDDHAEGTES